MNLEPVPRVHENGVENSCIREQVDKNSFFFPPIPTVYHVLYCGGGWGLAGLAGLA